VTSLRRDLDIAGLTPCVEKYNPAFMTTVRILLADDHADVRRGVRTILERESGWIVCGEVSTGSDAVARAVDLQPDVVLLDLSMPELNGLEAARQIRRLVTAKILILTVHEIDEIQTEVLGAGAHGCVLKADAGRSLVRAIRAVIASGAASVT